MEPKERMKRLVELSQAIEVENNIPVTKYIRSGKEMLKKATSFEEQGEIERAFILYLRYATLFLEKVIRHPEYNKLDGEEKSNIKQQCNVIFDRAEKLKTVLLEKFDSEYKNSAKDTTTTND